MNEYGLSITFGFKGSWSKTSLWSGGATRIGSSVEGGHEIGEAGAWFFPLLCTYAI